MKRISSNVRRIATAAFGVLFLLAFLAGILFVAFRARREENGVLAFSLAIVGFLLSLILAPTVHEAGHIVLAKANRMRIVYTKFFCFRFAGKEGKLRFSFASPFSPEETQTLPLCGGKIGKRAALYTSGGIFFGLLYVALTTAAALFVRPFSPEASYLFRAGIPYGTYLFLLNAIPATYPSGKTDAAILRGILNSSDEEKTMLSAMEIYGELSEGKRFSEISENLYFDLPQLPEDAPMYALILDLRYRYRLDRGETERAADCLNRLASSAAYLSERTLEEVAAELVYLHSLRGDPVRAEESLGLCRAYLSENTASAKRILAAYSAARGETEKTVEYKRQAEECLKKEKCEGIKKYEQALLARI